MSKRRKTPNHDIRIPNQHSISQWGSKGKHAVDMSSATEDEEMKVRRFEKRNILKPKKLK